MRAIIVDDEPDNVRLLALQLTRYCPQVELVGQFTDSNYTRFHLTNGEQYVIAKTLDDVQDVLERAISGAFTGNPW